jgi:hypothetical protein
VEQPAEYVAARRVLLDALEALGPQRRSVILVGAQAIYLRYGQGDLAVAPMTTDADLAMHVDWVQDEPELYAAMHAAGFLADEQPGRWRGCGDVCVDLMVVPHQSGRKGRNARAANVPPHRTGVARIVRGLEPSLVDHHRQRVESMEQDDSRSFSIRVAGSSALLVAKLIKLNERFAAIDAGERGRVRAKDALDIYRLLRSTDSAELLTGFETHRQEPHAAAVSDEAVELLRNLGTSREARLPRLAAQAVGGDPVTAASFAILARELVHTLRGRSAATTIE